MAVIYYGEYVGNNHTFRTEYDADNTNFDFMYFETGSPYNVTICKDNVGEEIKTQASATGTRKFYQDGELYNHEPAGSTPFADITSSDVSFTENFYNYIDSQYQQGTARDILKALQDSVDVHKWTLAGTTSYALGDTLIQGELKLNSVTENSTLLYAQNNNPSALYEPASSLEWTLWDTFYPNGSAVMPRATALALLKVNDDIKNHLIDVPDYIKDILKDTIPKDAIVSEDRAFWTVNIDGDRNPIISITVEGKNKALYNNANIWYQSHLKYNWEQNPPTTEWKKLGYNQQPVTYAWNDEYTALNGVGTLDKIRGVIANLGEGEYLRFLFSLAYTETSTGNTRNTAVCYADVSYKGAVEGYGIYPYGYNENDGSTVTITRISTDDVITPFPTGDIDVPEDPLDPNDPTSPIQAVSGVSLLTKSYEMTSTQLKRLGKYLWSTPFTENILDLNQSPIENILSCKVYPFDIPNTQSEEYITIGNVTTDTKGNPLAENTNIVINVGSFNIPTYYSNLYPWGAWIDYKTSISLFLPYIGLMPIDTASYLGKKLTVKYYVDIITGVCKACLYVRGINESANKDVLVDEFAGTIGVDIPITSNNRAQQELTRITSFANAGASLITGNYLGAVTNAFTGFVRPKDQIGHAGSCSPTCDMMTTHDVFIVISRPKVTYAGNYGHVNGFPCYNAYTLNNLKGFTRCVNVDLRDIVATAREKDEIKAQLESGIYISPQYSEVE